MCSGTGPGCIAGGLSRENSDCPEYQDRNHYPDALRGRSILVVEDEPLIAMDISLAFEQVGALVTTTHTLKHALVMVENDGLHAAILDHALGDQDSTILCERLTQRGIPYLIYSGFRKLKGACHAGAHVSKPATGAVLVATMEALLRQKGD